MRAKLVAALLVAVVLLALAQPGPEVSVIGDSIAKGCCSTVKPSDHLAQLGTVTVRHSSKTAGIVAIVPSLPPGLVYAHIGVNDVRDDNPNAERDMRALLGALAKRQDLFVVIDTVGDLPPPERTKARELARVRLNRIIVEFRAPNVVVLPYEVSSLPDGIHPDAAGYAEHMPRVIALLRVAPNLD